MGVSDAKCRSTFRSQRTVGSTTRTQFMPLNIDPGCCIVNEAFALELMPSKCSLSIPAVEKNGVCVQEKKEVNSFHLFIWIIFGPNILSLMSVQSGSNRTSFVVYIQVAST